MNKTFVGFGFGPIQSGLFLLEAYESGNFSRLVVAEVSPSLVEAVRATHGTYTINVAGLDGICRHVVQGVDVYNPQVGADRQQLVAAIGAASEIATALPSVDFYSRGTPSPAKLLADGLRVKLRKSACPAVVYAAENHNHAAQLLHQNIEAALPAVDRDELLDQVQFVNTVIGKMSGVVSEAEEIARVGLTPLVPSGGQAVLVEQFNRILIERISIPAFERGLNIFQEQPQLRPFEEAKLYGHNAAHALMGYLADRQGLRFMSEIDGELRELVTEAFLEESGRALCARHAGVAPLFAEAGWREYVHDLITRMTNPHLQDRVSRVIRDPLRKLGWDDRLVGSMRMALSHGVRPWRYARGAAAAVKVLLTEQNVGSLDEALKLAWSADTGLVDEREEVRQLINEALEDL